MRFPEQDDCAYAHRAVERERRDQRGSLVVFLGLHVGGFLGRLAFRGQLGVTDDRRAAEYLELHESSVGDLELVAD